MAKVLRDIIPLDEISKELAGRYAKKAHSSGQEEAWSVGVLSGGGTRGYKGTPHEWLKDIKSRVKKAKNRETGVGRAIDRLSKKDNTK